jgi:electron transport complex protein RnfE
LSLTLIPDHPGFLLAILPPGAFMGLGLLIAARNGLNSWLAGRARADAGIEAGHAGERPA